MNYLLFVIIFFALIFDRLNIFLFLIISSILHETGHIAVCIISGVKPVVKPSVFGIKLCNYPKTRVKKTAVVMAGPFTNFIIILICYYLLKNDFRLNIYIFMLVNTVVFIFNMLPVYFLDGGQLVSIFFDNPTIHNILDVLSFVFIFTAVIVCSSDKIISLFALLIFAVYYCINRYLN